MLLFYAMLHLVHLKEFYTFLWAALVFLENLREWLSLTKTTSLNFLPCANLILLLYITKVPRAGRDWLYECYPFKISIPGNSYYMCFDYVVVYQREKR